MYCIPLHDQTLNLPVRFKYTLPLTNSANTAKQNISLFIVRHACSIEFMLSTNDRTSTLAYCLEYVDLVPNLVQIMCPLSVADDGGRYFDMSPSVKPGNDLCCSFSMATSQQCYGVNW